MPVTGLDNTKVWFPSSRKPATVHRTVAFKWVRVHSPYNKKRERPKGLSLFLVPVTGLEPVRHRWRRILSPLRLPFHHTGRCTVLFGASRVPVYGCGARNFLFALRSRNFDRCPSLGSLLPPQAALSSLPKLSPAHHCWRRILSPLRLLFSHTGMVLT